MNHQPKPSLSICHTKKTHKHMHLLSLADEHKKTARCHHAASAVVVVVIADPYFRLSLPVAAAATIIIENVVPVAHHDDIAASLCLCVHWKCANKKSCSVCCFCLFIFHRQWNRDDLFYVIHTNTNTQTYTNTRKTSRTTRTTLFCWIAS